MSMSDGKLYGAACIEWLFADTHAAMDDRIRQAKAHGFQAVEFHLWNDKPIEAMRRALDETGIELVSLCIGPRRSLVDPAQHAEFLDAVTNSLPIAKQLGTTGLVVASGFTREGVSRQEQHEAAVTALREGAGRAADQGLVLLLEPLNTRVDHVGMFLDSTTEGLDIVEEVGSPGLRLLWDKYHSATMDEDALAVLSGRLHLVNHVQVADRPGRNEPGTGDIDWPDFMATMRKLGYSGPVGLEYRPTLPAAQSIAKVRSVLPI